MKKKLLFFVAILIGVTSCDTILIDDELTTDDVVKGLKTALNIGTDSSTAMLSTVGGYYDNPALKIPLPNEAEAILERMEFIRKYSSTAADLIDGKMEDLVRAINRSAEEAATEAKPIFTDAITNLTVVDGWEILNGKVPTNELKSGELFDSLAATKYLKNQTYNALVGAYSPKMNAALDKKFIGNASAASLWNDITSNYNGFCNQYGALASAAAKLAGKSISFNEVNTDIGEFVTCKALDGLFVKVGEQEKSIRKNPFQWASDLLQRVFSSVKTVVQQE